MVTATVTAIEPTTVNTNDNTLSKWGIQERTQNRVEYEYDRALYGVKILDGDYKTVYLLGHILGKSMTEIKEELSHVEA